MALGRHIERPELARALSAQSAAVALAKRGAATLGTEDGGCAAQSAGEAENLCGKNPEDQEVQLVDVPIIQLGPAAHAWYLLQKATATEEHIDVTALFAQALQRRWLARTNKDTHILSNCELLDNVSLLLLGGGGCGKSHWLLHVLKPLTVAFFGPRSFLPQCQSNAGARLLDGRTIHASIGLTPKSNLSMEALHLTAADKKRLELSLIHI